MYSKPHRKRESISSWAKASTEAARTGLYMSIGAQLLTTEMRPSRPGERLEEVVHHRFNFSHRFVHVLLFLVI